MTRWQVELKHRPEKILHSLPADVRRRVAAELDALVDDPRHPGCEKLRGHDLYKVRVGDWQIVYTLEDDRLIVLVLGIEPRGRAYRGL